MTLILLLALSATYRVAPSLPSASPVGALNLAESPGPSRKAAEPSPAQVVTTVEGVSLRMRWLPVSAIQTFPEESTASPAGEHTCADAPVLSTQPHAPEPASATVTPLTVLALRTLWLLRSAMYTKVEKDASPLGCQKLTLPGAPSANVAAPLPLCVVTVPVLGSSLRRRLLSLSPIKTLSLASSAIPVGLLKVAPTPTPLAAPAAPLPARVLTMQPPMDAVGVSVGVALGVALGGREGVVEGVEPALPLGVALGVGLRLPHV